MVIKNAFQTGITMPVIDILVGCHIYKNLQEKNITPLPPCVL